MKLRINFTDFWLNFNKEDNFFWNLLSTHYELELSTEPDVLFFSVFGDEYKKYNCLRIFYSGEYYEPKLYNADLSISFSRKNSEGHYRFPLYALFFDIADLEKKPSPETIIREKTKFCCFVVSNKNCKIRNEFFRQLSKYKKVDSGGRYLNNIGVPVENKMDFIRQYKFVISFENISRPGYISEKLAEPMMVNSVPIYWGDPEVEKDFNTKSFIHLNNRKDMNAVIDNIIHLNENDNAFMELLAEPWLHNNKANKQYLHSSLLEKLVHVIDNRYNITLASLYNEPASLAFIDRIKRKMRGERIFKN